MSEMEITQALKELVTHVKNGECILFLGAGVHAAPPQASPYTYPEAHRPPLGGDLAKTLADETNFKKKFSDESPRDLQRVSLYIETTEGLGRKKLVDLLDKYLRLEKRPSPALKMLAALPFNIIVTTNYDRLLESALSDKDTQKDPAIFVYNPNPGSDERTPDVTKDPTAGRPLLFKMHGDLDKRDSIVITDEDYITFVQRMSDKDALHPVPQTVRLATASGDRTAKVWDASSGKELFTLSGHDGRVYGIAFSPDGKGLATTSFDKTAKVWDVSSGKELFTLSGHDGRVYGIAFSPDGTRLATAGEDGKAKVWDVSSGKELFTLSGHTNAVWGVAFRPDGTRLATASGDKTAKVWDASSGQELFTLSGHTNAVWGVAFSPDGTRLATASFDKTAKVWHASSGQELLTLSGHTDPVLGVAFSPDGTRLATAGGDRTVRMYALNIEDLMALARKRITRSLTPAECEKYLHVKKCPPTP